MALEAHVPAQHLKNNLRTRRIQLGLSETQEMLEINQEIDQAHARAIAALPPTTCAAVGRLSQLYILLDPADTERLRARIDAALEAAQPV